MAPSPRIVVSERGHLELEEENNDEDPAFEGLDAERRSIRYYESRKVLGSLYRSIAEHQFLQKMQSDRTDMISSLRISTSLLATLFVYLERHTYGILYHHHLDLAKDIRDGYAYAGKKIERELTFCIAMRRQY